MDEKATVHVLYKKLLNVYPQRFREQFGESMEQTFNDLYKERKHQSGQGLFLYRFLPKPLSELFGNIYTYVWKKMS